MTEDIWKFAERYEAALTELNMLRKTAESMETYADGMSREMGADAHSRWFSGRADAMAQMKNLIEQSLSKLTEGAE